jgi:hypothetical protein
MHALAHVALQLKAILHVVDIFYEAVRMALSPANTKEGLERHKAVTSNSSLSLQPGS